MSYATVLALAAAITVALAASHASAGGLCALCGGF